MLADAPGLGKSHTAIAAARAVSDAGVVVGPAVLRTQWRLLLDGLGLGWPFVSDGVLSRRSITVGTSDVVIVDEAHRFRNPATRRYEHLRELIGSRLVLFVSATPVQNTRNDLIGLLRLALPDHAIAGSTPDESRDALGRLDRDDELFAAIVETWVVCRTAAEARRWNASFPVRWGPGLSVPERSNIRHTTIVASTVPSEVAAEVAGVAEFVSVFAEESVALLRTTLLRRLASSPEGASETLWRMENFLERLREARAVGSGISRAEFLAVFGADPTAQLAQQVLPFWYAGDTACGLSVAEVSARLDAVRRVRGRVSDAPLGRSEKGNSLVELVSRDARRMLIFTEYGATARAVRDTLGDLDVILLTGAEAALSGVGRVSRATALRVFAGQPPRGFRPGRILVATPVASEGLDLPGVDVVVHFDLPWNPARLAQREGRAARMGGDCAVEVVRFRPPDEVEAELRLEDTLSRKEGLARTRRSRTPPSSAAEASRVPRLARRAPGFVAGEGVVVVIVWLDTWRARFATGVGVRRLSNLVAAAGDLEVGALTPAEVAAARSTLSAGSTLAGTAPMSGSWWQEAMLRARVRPTSCEGIDALVDAASRPLGRARALGRQRLIDHETRVRGWDADELATAVRAIPDGECDQGPVLVIRRSALGPDGQCVDGR